MVTSSLLWNDDTTPRKSIGIHEVNRITMVNAKLDVLRKKLERLDMKVIDISIRCKICGGGHASMDCSTLNAFPNE